MRACSCWSIDVFRRILESIERLLYTVDEWLRFRSGESRMSFVAQGRVGPGVVLGRPTSCDSRVNVLIEPQINPIKHFPVVTVSHKLLLAAVRAVRASPGADAGHRHWPRHPIATAIIWCIPGVFGFLVWELKENWRLYAANRADRPAR